MSWFFPLTPLKRFLNASVSGSVVDALDIPVFQTYKEDFPPAHWGVINSEMINKNVWYDGNW